MSEIDLSIVIVSFNVCELLKQCLESVAGYSSQVGEPGTCDLRLETIVIDNASSDTSAHMVQEKFPSVRLIANTNNLGFAAANNQGFAQSSGRYVMMLNPDTVVRKGAFSMMIGFMDANPRAAVCGGKLFYPDGTFQHSAFHFPTLPQILLDFFPLNRRLTNSRINGRYPRASYLRGNPFPVDHPLGAAFMVRRQVAEQIGWLDEKFFMYCEEIDWVIRFKREGWQVWCIPQAEFTHYEAQSTRQFRDQSFVNLWRARFHLFDKHYSRLFRFSARWIVRLGLGHLSRRAQHDAQKGVVTQDDLQKNIQAYHAVREMALHRT